MIFFLLGRLDANLNRVPWVAPNKTVSWWFILDTTQMLVTICGATWHLRQSHVCQRKPQPRSSNSTPLLWVQPVNGSLLAITIWSTWGQVDRRVGTTYVGKLQVSAGGSHALVGIVWAPHRLIKLEEKALHKWAPEGLPLSCSQGQNT